MVVLWMLAGDPPCFLASFHRRLRVPHVTRTALMSGLPPPALEGTNWTLNLDIGRTYGSYMPLSWATEGNRLNITLLVEFCAGGKLKVHRAPKFMGLWTEPPENVFGLVQLSTALQAVLPESTKEISPVISDGKWEVEEEGGRLVKFHVETNGFRRESIWLPKRQLDFRAKAYGPTLAPGKYPAVTIVESLYVLGLTIGVVLIFIAGPLCLLSLVLWAIGDLRICVGTWSCQRVENNSNVAVPPVLYKQDEASTWQ